MRNFRQMENFTHKTDKKLILLKGKHVNKYVNRIYLQAYFFALISKNKNFKHQNLLINNDC